MVVVVAAVVVIVGLGSGLGLGLGVDPGMGQRTLLAANPRAPAYSSRLGQASPHCTAPDKDSRSGLRARVRIRVRVRVRVRVRISVRVRDRVWVGSSTLVEAANA